MITTAKTTTARSGTSATTQRGQPEWCIPEGQLRNQLHRQWSPSDQNQPPDSIERQGDRARQH
jgi:hypothetical protein